VASYHIGYHCAVLFEFPLSVPFFEAAGRRATSRFCVRRRSAHHVDQSGKDPFEIRRFHDHRGLGHRCADHQVDAVDDGNQAQPIVLRDESGTRDRTLHIKALVLRSDRPERNAPQQEVQQNDVAFPQRRAHTVHRRRQSRMSG